MGHPTQLAWKSLDVEGSGMLGRMLMLPGMAFTFFEGSCMWPSTTERAVSLQVFSAFLLKG